MSKDYCDGCQDRYYNMDMVNLYLCDACETVLYQGKRKIEVLTTEGRKQELLIESYEEACSDDINKRVKECVEKYLDGNSQ